jgi:plastocyanin
MLLQRARTGFGARLSLGLAAVALSVAACGGTAATQSPAGESPEAGATTVDVTLQEWAVVPAVTTAKAGSVTFKVTNKGPNDTHEFVVFRTDLDQRALPTGDDGSVDEEGAGVEAIGELEDVTVGSTGDVTFELQPGKYVFVCNLVEQSGGTTEVHYKLGMSAAFTVE